MRGLSDNFANLGNEEGNEMKTLQTKKFQKTQDKIEADVQMEKVKIT
jgi:hypothetical protein